MSTLLIGASVNEVTAVIVGVLAFIAGVSEFIRLAGGIFRKKSVCRARRAECAAQLQQLDIECIQREQIASSQEAEEQ